jgi:formylglycine-generating enzyme required for sulfatase activity
MWHRNNIKPRYCFHSRPFLLIGSCAIFLVMTASGCVTMTDETVETHSIDLEQAPATQTRETKPSPAANDITPLPSNTPTPELLSNNDDWQVLVSELNGLPIVYVPAGCFWMGSTESQIETAKQACADLYSDAPFPCDAGFYQSEGPQHEVCLDGFWIGQTEVTNRQYAHCVEAGVCSPPLDQAAFNDPAYADHPVIQVTWTDAMRFAEWAGARLPTEAEWEYAARGPDGWTYPWGDVFKKDRLNYCDVNCDVYFWADATYDDGYALTSPAGSYPAGASWVGALDMSGNAWEWVSSLYADYPYDADDGREDPSNAGNHVLRGGAFDLSYLDLRAALRYVLPADGSCRGYGFRLAMDADSVAEP